MTNECRTCKFYEEVCPADDIDHVATGICTIKNDRLPLWMNDVSCETNVAGIWENCPTWTAKGEVTMVADPNVTEGLIIGSIQEAPRWLPVGEVCNVGLIVNDLFPYVLDFALANIELFLSEDARMLKRWKSLPFDESRAEKRLADLHHILNTLCPPDYYFGSKIGEYTRVGVWER